MIRIIIFLLAVGLVALGIAWLADRPGEVTVLWMGLRIETSVMVAIFAIAMVVALLVFLWSVMRSIVRAPDLFALFLRNRRGAKGYQAISKGLIAIGSGDAHAARKHAQDARRLAPGEPLALLLSAQTAQIIRRPRGCRARFRGNDPPHRYQAPGSARSLRRGAAPQRHAVRRALTRRKPRRFRPRPAGPGRRCSNSAPWRATGPAR